MPLNAILTEMSDEIQPVFDKSRAAQVTQATRQVIGDATRLKLDSTTPSFVGIPDLGTLGLVHLKLLYDDIKKKLGL